MCLVCKQETKIWFGVMSDRHSRYEGSRGKGTLQIGAPYVSDLVSTRYTKQIVARLLLSTFCMPAFVQHLLCQHVMRHTCAFFIPSSNPSWSRLAFMCRVHHNN